MGRKSFTRELKSLATTGEEVDAGLSRQTRDVWAYRTTKLNLPTTVDPSRGAAVRSLRAPSVSWLGQPFGW
ncbi:hypothetical protein AYO39_00475 [Actinobacteria bacterium SCGC AG-212-D09]|nr:hypothetical protein AYO39_00475 [Actinobacteria bacterium SCGC AG-212-D09]